MDICATERDTDRDFRRSLTTISALVEAASGHSGLATETRFCLDQLAAEVRGLTQAYHRLAARAAPSSSGDVPARAAAGSAARRDAILLCNVDDEVRPRQVDFEAGLSGLTPQERRILLFIAEGCTNRQIASELFLAEKTVKNYVSNLLRKLGMERRTQAAVYAMRAANNGHPPAASIPFAGDSRSAPSARAPETDAPVSPLVLPSECTAS